MQVGLVAKIATVEDNPLWLDNALIYPVPDEATKHALVRANLVPILLEITQGVAHAVSIL